MSNLFFTYGTLMRGQVRHEVLASAKFLGEAQIDNARLLDTGYGFPAIQVPTSTQKTPSDPARAVYGEVYEVSEDHLWRLLDTIEAGLYTRQEHCVHIPSRPVGQRNQVAQVYVWNELARPFAEMRVIESGRWRSE